MRITKRELRKLIRESIKLQESINSVTNLSEEERKELIDSIDWAGCGLPDGAKWQQYTIKTYETSKKNRKSKPQISDEQYLGCLTVPIRWTALTETREKMLKKFQINIGKDRYTTLVGLELDPINFPFDANYGSFVKYYKEIAKGTKVHSEEFNKQFLTEFLNAVREALPTSQYNSPEKMDDPEEYYEHVIGQIRRAFIRVEKQKTNEYMECISAKYRKSLQ